MGKRLYLLTRDVHLYLGLFLSPFVLVFAISVFYLVHLSIARQATPPPARLVTDLPVTEELERLTGREQVDALRPVLDRLGAHGEISFIRRVAKEHRLVIPVLLPGREMTVDLNLVKHSATVSARATGTAEAMIHLHKMPGPHNAAIRGNTMYLQAWRVLADVTSYGLLFLSLSGVYLWAVLKAERRIGVVLASLGAISLCGLVYVVTY